MIAGQQIRELDTRRRLLAMQSDIHRKTLRLQLSELRARGSLAGKTLHQVQPALLVAAPVVGYLLVRRWPALKNFATRGFLGWAALRRAGRIVSSLMGK